MTTADVRFADVEAALADRDRLEWLLPVLDSAFGDEVGNLRTQALSAGLLLGKTGRDLVDFAREGCPV